MRIVSFAVKNFRSITATSKLKFCDGVTTLIGPNNEGKSNVLRALVAALEVASRLDEFRLVKGGRLLGRPLTEQFYNWGTDFPIAQQARAPKGVSELDLEFQLTPEDIAAFRTEVGSYLNGTLPIRIGLSQAEPTFAVKKRGRGQKTLSAKASKIAQFIGKRIDLQYIPAVRPAATSISVVERLVARELNALRNDPEYVSAVQRIEELQLPILHRIGSSIRETLKVFLPDVSDVQVRVPTEARFRALNRSCEVIIDDGTQTSLSFKGDGVQSLAALGLMRDFARGSTATKHLILAIEEPESHLHPMAIHQLREVLTEIAKQHQVIITTHCPLFVDRQDVGANILVADNRAAPAKTIRQIRETMGVRLSDNLIAAEVVLLVEGETDRTALRPLLSHHSQKLKQALVDGRLAIDTLSGGGNLGYKLTQVREAMCQCHSLIDNDFTGRLAVEQAQAAGILELADLTVTNCPGMAQSEFEDWYDASVLTPFISSIYGLPEVSPLYTATTKKWSERMKELFQTSGKPWNNGVEAKLKWEVANHMSARPTTAIHPSRHSVFDALVESLSRKLSRS